MYKQVATKVITNADSPYTLEPEYKRIEVDSSGGTVDVTIPLVSDLGVGFKIQFVHNSAGTLNINANVADSINDAQASVSSTTDGEVLDLETVAANLISIKTNLADAGGGGGGGGGGPQQFRVAFDSNLDTVSPPILMRGDLSTLNMYAETKLDQDATDIQARLDSTDTWTDITQGVNFAGTVANLLTWVNGNVGVGVNWEFRLIVAYDTGQTDESSILVEYESA